MSMRIVRSRAVLVATVLTMLAAGLLGSFPHGHAAASAAVTAHEHDSGSHPPRPARCLERDERFTGPAACTLCLFQRSVSQGWITPAVSADALFAGGEAVLQVERIVLAGSLSPGDPRAPPKT
jgi:hypothetical protein